MSEIISALTSKLGINETQAEGGLGLILKLAKDKLGGDFSSIGESIGDAESLIQKAPNEASGGIGGMLGGIASAIGGDKLAGVASLAAGFKSLDLDSDMIGNFLPVIIDFVREKGGDSVAGLLQKVLD